MSGSLVFHYDKLPHVKLEGNTFLTKKITSLGQNFNAKGKEDDENTKRSYRAKYKPYSVRILV